MYTHILVSIGTCNRRYTQLYMLFKLNAIVVESVDSGGLSRFAALHGYSPFGRVSYNGLPVYNKATEYNWEMPSSHNTDHLMAP